MAQRIALTRHADDRGVLTVASPAGLFEFKRAFWITGADSQLRGGHRHLRTRQLLIAVTGQCDIEVIRSGTRQVFVLKDPSDGLLLEPEDWHTMRFLPGATLLVLSSEDYDPADYLPEPLA